MMKLIACLAIGAAIVSVPSVAQARTGAPGGFYVGALGGFEGLDVEAADGSATASADSAVYGVNAGYDLSLGNAFVGVEGEISASTGSTSFPASFGGAREGLEADGQYYLGARAGFALTPGIAAYGKLGYSSLDLRSFTNSGSLAELRENTDGVRFGGGVQIALPASLEARLEYRHSKYSDLANVEQDDATTDQFVAGLAMRF